MTHLDDETWMKLLKHPDAQLGLPATPESLAPFESSHGFALPLSHRQFLLRANGGILGYVRLFGVDRDDALDLSSVIRNMQGELERAAHRRVIPFASDWGGSYYCYDVVRANNSEETPILYWNHEYSEEPADWPLLWSDFAPDFVTFVRRVIE